MSRTVQCRKYHRPGLAVPPYPGPKGRKFMKLCLSRPGKWQAQQTMLINEKQLT